MLLAVLLLLFINSFSYAEDIQPGDNLPLPDIRWQDADGNTHQLSDSNGKPRLLHFWAAWCIPCRKEMPEMLTWKQQNPDILLIPLSLDQRMAQAQHFVKKYKLAMSPLLINKDDGDAMDIPVVPFTILVSSDGLFRAHYYGIAPWLENNFTTKIRQQFNLEQGDSNTAKEDNTLLQ